MSDLVLETKAQRDKTFRAGVISVTPPIDEDYWLFRVRLTDTQAIVGFPKFSTIGIGFAVEEDWNTNLPYTVPTKRIYAHIKHNKGDKTINWRDCHKAIRLVQDAAREYQSAD